MPYGARRRADAVPDAPALAIRDLSTGYPGTKGPVLHGISLKVPAATRIALVGPNGSGKSTLLKAVAGLLPGGFGEVEVYGNPSGACRHRVAYLPQRGEIDWRFPISVRRLVMTGRYVHLGWLKRPGKRDREIVSGVMEDLGLSPLAGRQIGQLSGGQQQRALLARALVQEGDLLLLDEPFNAVDAATREKISENLANKRGAGKTMVIATHDLASLSSEFDGAFYLRDGREVEAEPGAFVGLAVGKGAAWAR